MVTLHVSVWVEISLFAFYFFSFPRSRSTWACELKLNILSALQGHCESRSTWACELKLLPLAVVTSIFESRSTWACELKFDKSDSFINDTKSRSTWACELKSCGHLEYIGRLYVTLHVSVWVEITRSSSFTIELWVTLHVSVWVEIIYIVVWNFLLASRSTWACELKCKNQKQNVSAEQSRSTWACELKFPYSFQISLLLMSRSTWACELKYSFSKNHKRENGHAPRERVSWNLK